MERKDEIHKILISCFPCESHKEYEKALNSLNELLIRNSYDERKECGEVYHSIIKTLLEKNLELVLENFKLSNHIVEEWSSGK